MKNIAILLVAGLTTLSTACFNNGAKTKTANLSDDTTINSEKSIDGNSVTNSTSANLQEVKDTMVLGKLYFVNLKEGEQPVMTALSLNGDRCGTGDFNHKPYATEGIRSVFELNEWIEFNPQATAASGIKVMVFKHQADQGFYLKNSLNDETPGYVLACDLNKDPDDETFHWGSFYLHPEEVEPGYYDFVFIYNNKVFATMLTRFFQEEEIQGKPDSELEKLMSEKRQ
jgi:hypothetical protein